MLTQNFEKSYATQIVTPVERRIIANVLNGSIRAKAAMQHLAFVATDLALQAPTLSDDSDGSSSKKPRYDALRKYNLIQHLLIFVFQCESDSVSDIPTLSDRSIDRTFPKRS